jgi:putative transposase
MLARLIPSIGTVGDALDSALAETTIGLYKNRVHMRGFTVPPRPLHTRPIRRTSPLVWVHWFNTSRLGRRPPAEAEAEYYADNQIGEHTDHGERGDVQETRVISTPHPREVKHRSR